MRTNSIQSSAIRREIRMAQLRKTMMKKKVQSDHTNKLATKLVVYAILIILSISFLLNFIFG